MNLPNGIIYTIVIYPLELIYELIYSLSMRIVPIAGVSIIILSVFINTMLIPVYELIDVIQKEQFEKDKSVKKWTNHIKNNFDGDERFLMLKTYYRQKEYNPLLSLKGALPLALEIPFFIAAYHFLSNLSQLKGVPFLFLKDLALPDGLIVIQDMHFNLLPFLMTFINLISIFVCTQNAISFRDKMTLYLSAVIFLILLYNSPSGMVLYWTLNNICALIKNIVFAKRKNDSKDNNIRQENDSLSTKAFIICELVLILLLGVIIPSGVIKAAPLEFVDTSDMHNPLCLLIGSILIATGYFGLWLPFFYYIVRNQREKIYRYISVFSIIGLVDYYFFGTELGIISSHLKYVNDVVISLKEILINTLMIALIVLLFKIIYKYLKTMIYYVNCSLLIVLLIIATVNIINIDKVYKNADYSETSDENMNIPLSTKGKNVIVFMLDKAIGGFVPYIMNEKPELKKQFEGFTYYPNTISLGGNTTEASAAVLGGYDYTYDVVEDIDKRTEALTMLPRIFKDNGYEVTVFDPPYLRDQDISNLSLSVYENMDIKAYHAKDKFHYSYNGKDDGDRRFRNFFCYSLSKACPLAFNYTLYDGGYYNDVTLYATNSVWSYIRDNNDISKGTSFIYTFEQEYAELNNLPSITNIVSDDINTFFMGYNEATHEPTILQEPEYIPALYVDNTEYDNNNKGRFIVDGRKMNVNNAEQMQHYQVNVAALMQLGKWFDYMRANDVYDNTRIIIVSDHGWSLKNFDDMMLNGEKDLEGLNPVLMVKDFGNKEYSVDNSFMVNADVPALSLKDLVEEKVNPYTGNDLTDTQKYKNPCRIEQAGLEVKDNIFDLSNWSIIK